MRPLSPIEHKILDDLIEHTVDRCIAAIRQGYQLTPEGTEHAFIASVAASVIATIAMQGPEAPEDATAAQHRVLRFTQDLIRQIETAVIRTTEARSPH